MCTLPDDRHEARYEQIRPVLADTYEGAVERDSGYTLRFSGVDGTIEAVAEFVALERQCCSFAEYRIEVAPPYDGTRLTITGPDGTKELFSDGLVERLEAGSDQKP